MQTKTRTCFEAQVDNWVRAAVTSGARSLEEIICALPGVYPTVAVASLSRLQLERFIEPKFAGRVSRAVRNDVRNTVSGFSNRHQLPTPHPLDFDWRFTAGTANSITRVCDSLGRRLLCLGTPSVFFRAKRRCQFESARLVDSNAEMVRHLGLKHTGVIHHDISQRTLPRISPADVVAIDPPWYLQDLQEFVWFASKMCVNGGYLVACLPSDGTRPKVKDELQMLLAKSKDYGFSMYLERSNVLRYQTPHFERNALHAAGVVVRSDWRKGTLWILRKEREHNLPQPLQKSVPNDRWCESSVFGTRIRFKMQASFDFCDPTLTSIIDGDVLPSVSRRNPMRECVDVWTSGNRVFTCCGTNVLHQIATAMQLNQDVANFVRNKLRVSLNTRQLALLGHAAAQIKRIAILESKERGMSNYIRRGIRLDARTIT